MSGLIQLCSASVPIPWLAQIFLRNVLISTEKLFDHKKNLYLISLSLSLFISNVDFRFIRKLTNVNTIMTLSYNKSRQNPVKAKLLTKPKIISWIVETFVPQWGMLQTHGLCVCHWASYLIFVYTFNKHQFQSESVWK